MERKSRLALALAAALLLGLLSGCGQQESASVPEESGVSAQEAEQPSDLADVPEEDGEPEEPDAWNIRFSGDSISAEGTVLEGSVVTIKKGGVYRFSGTLEDGQILVDAKGEEVVLMLDGVDITCSDSAPIYIKKASLATIELAEGTENTVTDGSSYVFEEGTDEPDAAIFSKADLVFRGTGALTVNGSYDMAVHGKDTLTIQAGGTYDLTAVGDCLKGKDSVLIEDGILRITAGSDGIQSSNDLEDGTVEIAGGDITIQAGDDGIQSESSLTISGGTVDITAEGDGIHARNTIGDSVLTVSGGTIRVDAQEDGLQAEGDLVVQDGEMDVVTRGGSENAPAHAGDFPGGPWGRFNNTAAEEETQSAKALKSAVDITITGGRILIDSYDDAIHADGSVTVAENAEIELASGDDGIHADDTLTISGGTLNITQSYEGLEALFIDISGGDLFLKTSDDGMNANGTEIFGPGFGMSGRTDSLEEATTYLHISGGHIIVDTSGDGLDSNGFLLVDGGEVYVSGPSNSMNGALDSGTAAQINGGTLLAFGASGMDENFGSSSTQPSIRCRLSGTLTGDTPIALTDSDGNVLVEFSIDEPTKTFNSVVVSCPELTVGETYILTCGDETVDIELTDTVVSIRADGTSSGFGSFPGMPPGPGPGF